MSLLFFYNILLITAHIIFLSTISLIFSDQLVIESHFNANLLFLLGGMFLLSIYIISFSLSKIIGQKLSIIIMRTIIGLLLSLFSVNILSLFTILKSIMNYQDVLFTNRFITIKYLYSKQELYFFIDKYYQELSNTFDKLTAQTKQQILGDARTIDAVKVNVEAYVNYQKTAWWPKFTNFVSESLSWGVSWGFDHPVILSSGIFLLTGIIGYPLYKILKNQYNIYTIAISVGDLAQEVTDTTSRLDHLENACKLLIYAISKMNLNNKEIMRILSIYFGMESEIVETLNLDPEAKHNLRTHILSFTESIRNMLLETEKAPKLEELIVFNGEGHRLGGTATTSRLLNLNDRNE